MILLTGPTGGLGSHFAKAVPVTPLTRSILSTDANPQTIRAWCDKNIKPALQQGDPVVVVHTATDYGRSPESKTNQPWINEGAPLALLQWLKGLNQNGVFINCDTSLPESVSDYAKSKARFRAQATDLVSGSKMISLVHLKLEHLYGPGMGPHNFVTHVATQILRDQPQLELTEGRQLRDFIFVEDAVDAMLSVLRSALAKTPGTHLIPVGSGKPVSIRSLVEQIRDLVPGSKTRLLFGALPYRKDEPMESAVDLRAISQLGWSPRTGLIPGLKLTLDALTRKPID